jgi:hypothetical protein
MHNEELYALYSSINFIRVIESRIRRWAGHVARMGDRKRRHTVLVGKPERKGAPARPCNRCEYNIEMDITETGLKVVDWNNLAQYRCKRRAVVNTVMNFRVA